MWTGASLAVLPFSKAAAEDEGLDELARVFEEHGRRLKSLAYNLLGNEQDAEDAIQDAFLKAHRARAAFQNRASLHTWVYRVLVNTCLDEGRKRRRCPVVEVDQAVLPGYGAPIDQQLALRHALGELDSRQRAVFLMSSAEGLSHAEIAAALETTETNSRTLLFEARRKLKARLSR